MYPWASFGTFKFRREETAHWETDAGWVTTPTFVQVRPLGSTKDHIIATSIGSKTRTFEMILEPDRFDALLSMVNTVASFTDWTRPIPDSRQAFLVEVSALTNIFHFDSKGRVGRGGRISRGVHTRVSLVSQ
jgi:hypothetical protein